MKSRPAAPDRTIFTITYFVIEQQKASSSDPVPLQMQNRKQVSCQSVPVMTTVPAMLEDIIS